MIYEKLRQVEETRRCNMSESNLACSSQALSFPHLAPKATRDWGDAGSGECSHLVPPRCWKSIKYHLNPGQRWKSHAPCVRVLRVLQESQKESSPPLSWQPHPEAPSTPKPSLLSLRCADGRLVCTSVQLNVGNEPHPLRPRGLPLLHPRQVIHVVFACPDSQIGLPASF